MATTRKLNIIFLTADCSEQGTYFRWHNIAIGLSKLGHDVQVYSVDNSARAESRLEHRDGIVYHITKGHKGQSYFSTGHHPITSIARAMIQYPACDIVHVFQPYMNTFLPWMLNLRWKKAVTFFDWDDLWVDKLRDEQKREGLHAKTDYFFKGYLEKKIPAISKNMTVCSTFLKDLAIKRGARNVTVIPNGFWEFDVPEKEIARKKLGLIPKVLYAGFMGRTLLELDWCFEGLEACLEHGIQVRLAICGPPESTIAQLPKRQKDNIDYLGTLTPSQTRDFAASIDLGLLPLADIEFNQSRFPIKFAEYMAAGQPVLCSEVGEISRYAKTFPWVIKAGVNKTEWIQDFISAVKLVAKGQILTVDRDLISNAFSWGVISNQTENLYLNATQ